MGKTYNSNLAFRPDLGDALWAQFVAPFLDGAQPFANTITLHGVTDLESLLPIGSLQRSVVGADQTLLLCKTKQWSAVVRRFSGGSVSVTVLAVNQEALDKATAELQSRAPGTPDSPSSVPFDFWQVSNGAYSIRRQIEASSWADVRVNYPEPVALEVERLAGADLSDDVGRIVLWHGPPGTGKTSAIRALAREWQKQKRQFQVILDPDAIFAKASLLMEVLLGDEAHADRWRVLVVEDADELLRSDAKERVGQALSRLLNVGDGILGQGIKTLVLITTNEPVRRLHPALVRPGRCLAEVEFRRFTRAEASDLLGEDAGSDLSLADLMARRRGERPPTERDDSVGLYL